MIAFLRRIRQDLLQSNRVTMYVLYAIGEIALVVVGILIALQINNWNQDRIDRKQESEFLRRLISDIEVDRKLLDFAFAALDRKQEALLMAKRLSENNLVIPYDSLKSIIWDGITLSFGPPNERQNATYNELVSSGNMGLIQNDKLRNQIAQFYTRWDHTLVRIERRITDYGSLVYKLDDFYNVLPLENNSQVLTRILEKIKLNDEFQPLLMEEINYSGFLRRMFDELSIAIDELIPELESEIVQNKPSIDSE